MSMRYEGGFLTASYDPLRVPNAPTVGTLSNVNTTTLSLTFTAPSNVGGGSITGYTVVATDSSSGATFFATGSSSPISITGLTQGNTYTAKVYATNLYGPSDLSAASNSAVPQIPIGQQAYTTPGTYSWIAPSQVTSVSVVVVGGGGSGYSAHDSNGGGGGSLGYKNNITVVPGNSYTVVVGAGGAAPAISSATSNAGGESYFINNSTVQANGGAAGAGTNIGPTPNNGGYVGDGGGLGGYGTGARGGGCGAGGYSGTGGLAATTNNNPTDPSSGSGGGGAGVNINDVNGAAGGGVGILGLGADGDSPLYNSAWAYGSWTYSVANSQAFIAAQGGTGGSGGGNPTAVANGASVQYPFRTDGGAYGGGGGGGYSANGPQGGKGGDGAVRIIWPATGSITRAFPSTNTGDL